jgi:hypothetical protein
MGLADLERAVVRSTDEVITWWKRTEY